MLGLNLRLKKIESIFEMIIIDLKGWEEITSSGFQRVLQIANPKFEIASPKYYYSQLDKNYEKLKAKLKSNMNFDNPESFAISIDAWSQYHNGHRDNSSTDKHPKIIWRHN